MQIFKQILGRNLSQPFPKKKWSARSFVMGILCALSFSSCRTDISRTTQQEWVFPLSTNPSSAGGIHDLSAGLNPIFFAQDQGSISRDEHAKLDEIQARIQDYDGKLILTGYASPSGSPEYDRQLGEQRALMVREALILKGFDPERLITRSFGSDRYPKDPLTRNRNTTRDCVEFNLPQGPSQDLQLEEQD